MIDKKYFITSLKSETDPLLNEQEQEALERYLSRTKITKEINDMKSAANYFNGSGITDGFDENSAWIQTYSGRRFNPTNPNPDAIVIQDVAHALSMQCRFSGHVKKFYSVAQHSVGVSYLCDKKDALWGLLHDASEAYLVDVPKPLKLSGKFDAYIEFEKNMMQAVCKKFNLSEEEPPSVKEADQLMLSIEAEQLMKPLRKDWVYTKKAPPFSINPLNPEDAERLFLKRFFEILGVEESLYQKYIGSLHDKYIKTVVNYDL